MSITGDFRPIQYLGSKWRILDQVADAVAKVADSSRPKVADLFSGSGVVSRRLAQTSPVIASDIQEYSRVLTSAQLAPAAIDASRLFDDIQNDLLAAQTWLGELMDVDAAESESANSHEWIAFLLEHGSLATLEGSSGPHAGVRARVHAHTSGSSDWILLHHYGGVYFSYRQAAELDAILRNVRALRPSVRDTALAAAMSAATDMSNSVGSHFAQPIRPRNPSGVLKLAQLQGVSNSRSKSALSLFSEKLLRFSHITPPPFQSRAIRASFEDALATMPDDVGTVYADPPYTREHYSRFYHVLETIALGDQPGLTTNRVRGANGPSRGLYRVDRHQSPFSIVSQAPAAFDHLFSSVAARDTSIVLSYSPVPENEKPRARVIGMDELLKLAKASYLSVEVIDATGIRHSKFNSRALNAPAVDEAEVLIVCQQSRTRKARS